MTPVLKKLLVSFIATSLYLFPFWSEARKYLPANNKLSAELVRIQNYNLDFNAERKQQTSQDYSVEEVKKKPKNLDTKLVSAWNLSLTDMQSVFERVRDTRVLNLDSNFPRRPTWLFLDDGCYARAEIASQELQSWELPAPSKIFAFGSLAVTSEYSPKGKVRWWYHVAIGYRATLNGKETIFIFDPSIDYTAPLKLEEWIKSLGGTAKISICSASAIDPDSSCKNEPAVPFSTAQDFDANFLEDEWDRLVLLKKNPYDELGDAPPWLFGSNKRNLDIIKSIR